MYKVRRKLCVHMHNKLSSRNSCPLVVKWGEIESIVGISFGRMVFISPVQFK